MDPRNTKLVNSLLLEKLAELVQKAHEEVELHDEMHRGTVEARKERKERDDEVKIAVVKGKLHSGVEKLENPVLGEEGDGEHVKAPLACLAQSGNSPSVKVPNYFVLQLGREVEKGKGFAGPPGAYTTLFSGGSGNGKQGRDAMI